MKSHLQKAVESDYKNFTQFCDDEAALDGVLHRYKWVNVRPQNQYGSLDASSVSAFARKVFPELGVNAA